MKTQGITLPAPVLRRRESKIKTGIDSDRQHLLNENIRAKQVLLIDKEGRNIGLVPLEDALRMAGDDNLDLVQMAADEEHPVCKVMDYGKHLFLKKKQQSKQRHHRMQVKEIKFRSRTGEADYKVKLRNLVRFLEQGDKTKVTLRYRGRELAHRELGERLLQRVQQDLAQWGTVEQEPMMDRRQLSMVIAPRHGAAARAAEKTNVQAEAADDGKKAENS